MFNLKEDSLKILLLAIIMFILTFIIGICVNIIKVS